MTSPLAQIVAAHKAGAPVGVTSVCSAHPLVIEAAMRQCQEDGAPVLIEATSNQVDQFGGYTGMTPVDFRVFVEGIADKVGLDRSRLVLGGDHLGPNRWQGEPAEMAMTKAEELVAAYVAAGFEKIHLDCSMACADDPTSLGDGTVSTRAARLLAVAERVSADVGGLAPRYVIGTEVPVPGGAHEEIAALTPTAPESARATLEAHREAVAAAGFGHVWPRVMALVVQPGVEFDHLKVVDYDRSRVGALKEVLAEEPGLVFEAHSTDYQTAGRLAALVEDHWAVLKVGPGLTFALREAFVALGHIESELVSSGERAGLLEAMERRMLEEPRWWAPYYTGDATAQRIARRWSYSDRMRYYWPDPEVAAAQSRLLARLDALAIPETLVRQYLPRQYDRVRDGSLPLSAHALVVDHIRDELRPYAAACRAGVLT